MEVTKTHLIAAIVGILMIIDIVGWYLCTITQTKLNGINSGVARIVARRGKNGNYVMGHSRRTSRPGAAAAR